MPFLFADDPTPLAPTAPQVWHAGSLPEALLATTVFGVLGIVLLALGFKVFEWITPKVDLEKQLEQGNVAVAVVVAALLLGLAWIVSRAMG